MKLTAQNAAQFLTVSNAMQHYARAIRDYVRDPTPERKALALRKGQLFYGHLRKLEGEPRYVWSLAFVNQDGSVDPYGAPHPTKVEVDDILAELKAGRPNGFQTTTIVKLRVMP